MSSIDFGDLINSMTLYDICCAYPRQISDAIERHNIEHTKQNNTLNTITTLLRETISLNESATRTNINSALELLQELNK